MMKFKSIIILFYSFYALEAFTSSSCLETLKNYDTKTDNYSALDTGFINPYTLASEEEPQTPTNFDALDTGFISPFGMNQPGSDESSTNSSTTNTMQEEFDAERVQISQVTKKTSAADKLSFLARSYFIQNNIKLGFSDLETFMKDLMADDQDALSALDYIAKKAKNFQFLDERRGLLEDLLKKIQSLSEEELEGFSNPVFINFLKIFKNAQLLPHHTFTRKFERSFLKRLVINSTQNISKELLIEFSLIRMHMPIRFSPYFLKTYRKYIVKNFEKFSFSAKALTFQSEVLASNPFLIGEIRYLASHLTSTLKNSMYAFEEDEDFISMQVYPFYVFTSYLKAKYEYILGDIIDDLKVTLGEYHLLFLEKNLIRDVRNSGKNENDINDYFDGAIIRALKKCFNDAKVSMEYKNPDRGIFYPVDFFVEGEDFIFELDGNHHFFYQLDINAEVTTTTKVYRLSDKTRNFSYNSNGFRVFRFDAKKHKLRNLDKMLEPYCR